ncbi:hypothetical protein ACFY2M_18135 [Streptomyces sp. NPDC001276]|uniref:hypothetical protein n=1 Tax=Streptomyces sp. NPDC001276 TaxID=3364555 RepID=UPI0036839DF8
MRSNRIVAITAGVVAVGSLLVAAPPAAAETTLHGCAWPRVCFYQTDADWTANRWQAAYQDADYNQKLSTAARGADWVYNSRNDDTVLIRSSSNSTYAACLNPNSSLHSDASVTITDIRIRSTPSKCEGLLVRWPG